MNLTQINDFLVVARTLNFTRAAQLLYISQPALSKQITAMERELNMQLFLRDQKSVRLTPVGVLLLKELPGLLEHYDGILERARAVNSGHSGALVIGTLEGQWPTQEFTDAFRAFTARYPNISVQLVQDSFGGLHRQLDAGTIDLAVSLDFDIKYDDSLLWVEHGEQVCMLALSRDLPIAGREKLALSDLRDETFLLMDPKESRFGAQMMIEQCRRSGFEPIVKYAPNNATVMLWIEMGLGVGIIGDFSAISQKPNVRLLHEIHLGLSPICCAWKRNNLNPAIPLFTAVLQAQSGSSC